MRQLLTGINNYDYCLTEFIRVVDSLVPTKSFYRSSPELLEGGQTIHGTPIRVQLLGQDSNWLAENAIKAITLGSNGIDINFGCPAKTVNKNRGGASLLKSPETIFNIVSTVKQAIAPLNHELSIKIRLGFDDSNLFEDIIRAISDGNADLITIHARTKKQGYRPPAYWEYIANAKNMTTIPLIANGEIWDLQTAQDCMKKSNCLQLMLGRGALATPNLGSIIRGNANPIAWDDVCRLIKKFHHLSNNFSQSYYFSSRLKQWLKYLQIIYPQAAKLFLVIKPMNDNIEILRQVNLSTQVYPQIKTPRNY